MHSMHFLINHSIVCVILRYSSIPIIAVLPSAGGYHRYCSLVFYIFPRWTECITLFILLVANYILVGCWARQAIGINHQSPALCPTLGGKQASRDSGSLGLDSGSLGPDSGSLPLGQARNSLPFWNVQQKSFMKIHAQINMIIVSLDKQFGPSNLKAQYYARASSTSIHTSMLPASRMSLYDVSCTV
jgi:hypothetical protein